jgi:hypothetical protein
MNKKDYNTKEYKQINISSNQKKEFKAFILNKLGINKSKKEEDFTNKEIKEIILFLKTFFHVFTN